MIFKNIDEWVNKLNERIDSISDNESLKIAVLDTHAKMTERIFEKGENITGETFDYGKSYAAYRKSIGRQANHVDFSLTGNLQSDFRGGVKTGNKPTRVNKNTYRIELKRLENVKKRVDLDSKYSVVFQINKSEIDSFNEIFKKEIIFRLNA